MTVHPGSVLAASSTSCFVNGGKQPTPVLFTEGVAPDTDVWQRYSVELLTIKDGTTDLPGSYFKPLPGHTGVYWKFVSNDVAPTITTYAVDGVNLTVTRTNVFKQALVLVDSSGALAGFHWESGIAGSKITKSCYTSFKP